jgi:hemolysin activation/secretion protein
MSKIVIRYDIYLLLLFLVSVSVFPSYGEAQISSSLKDKQCKGDEVSSGQALPDITTPEKDKKMLFHLPHVRVRRFRLIGNTVFSYEDLSPLFLPYYEKVEITSEELQNLRQQITEYYIKKGYINSGVIIPDQKVIDNIITLQVIEGSLTEVKVEGNEYLHPSYIIDRIRAMSGSPLNQNRLKESLQILEQDPYIKQINAELSPGVMPGESILKIRVKEERPYKLFLEFNNNQSPSVGAERGEIHFAYHSLTGNGDILQGMLGATDGLTEIDMTYGFPLTIYDTKVEFHYRKNEATVEEEPFDKLNIKSKSDTYGLTLSQPIYRKSNRNLTVSLTGERRHSKSFLLGRRFSFSPSARDGQTDIFALRFAQQWVQSSQKQALNGRSTINWGINAFGATSSNFDEDSSFLSWLGQIRWLRRLSATNIIVVFRTDLQLSKDPLLPIEKFSIGGMDSVRGYRTNQLVRDNGLSSSIELRIPVIHTKQGEGIVHLAPFIDYGRSWNSDRDTPQPRTLASTGMGFLWKMNEKINFQFYGAFDLKKDVKTIDNDLQDKGIHFRLTVKLF